MNTTGAFLDAIKRDAVPAEGRRWLFVPYDQLTDRLGPLSTEDPDTLGIVLVESGWKGRRRPYHKQKLALVLANQRHFALEQAARGVAVRYLFSPEPYSQALQEVPGLAPLQVMEPAERELRRDLAGLVEDGFLEVIPHEGWLTTAEQFDSSQKSGPPWRMDGFYRLIRRETGILMDEDGDPIGGRFSFDAENRAPWDGEPAAPAVPTFEVDEITAEVGELIEDEFSDHPGRLDLESLPATQQDADRLWSWARYQCLAHFGPYEDAMSTRSRSLFHTRISALLNIQRLVARDVVADVVEEDDLPLASREGFIRQVLGWREFVRHVHRKTDGFRKLPEGLPSERPGAPSYLGAGNPLPGAYWEDADSGLNCLDSVVSEVWEDGYSHHITRLMVLSNIATLLDTDPRELTDWFWCAYTDAYDWVVEPNVLAMGTYAAGDLMTTKPYVSGANYIDKMSDYCEDCRYDPRSDCPLISLYWAFLERHRDKLADNPRMRRPYSSLERRSREKKDADREVFESLVDRLDL